MACPRWCHGHQGHCSVPQGPSAPLGELLRPGPKFSRRNGPQSTGPDSKRKTRMHMCGLPSAWWWQWLRVLPRLPARKPPSHRGRGMSGGRGDQDGPRACRGPAAGPQIGWLREPRSPRLSVGLPAKLVAGTGTPRVRLEKALPQDQTHEREVTVSIRHRMSHWPPLLLQRTWEDRKLA